MVIAFPCLSISLLHSWMEMSVRWARKKRTHNKDNNYEIKRNYNIFLWMSITRTKIGQIIIPWRSEIAKFLPKQQWCWRRWWQRWRRQPKRQRYDISFHLIPYLFGELQAAEEETHTHTIKSLPKKWHSGIQMEEFRRNKRKHTHTYTQWMIDRKRLKNMPEKVNQKAINKRLKINGYWFINLEI